MIAEHIYLETAELFLYGNDYGFPPEAGGEQQQAVVRQPQERVP